MKLLSCLMLCWLLWPAALLAAHPLATTRSISIAAPEGAVAPLLVAGTSQGLLALDATRAWWFDATTSRWSPAPWPAPPGLFTTAGNGRDSYLLAGENSRVKRVWRVEGPPSALRALPPPPHRLHGTQASIASGALVLAGLDDSGVMRLLRFDPEAASPMWVELATWPQVQAQGTVLRALLGQGHAMFAVLTDANGGPDRVWRWTPDEPWHERSTVPGQVLPGGSRASGQAHLVFLVRSDPSAAPKLMTLHTITNAWATLADTNATAARSVTPWQQGLVWSNAAEGSAPSLGSIEIESGRHLLQWLDWVVIVVYLVSMIGIGLYFYLREKRQSTSDFFVGGRTIPFWAAGVSLYAANTSSISYIAIPAKAFETNWQYLTNNLVAVVALMFVAVWIVPLLRRLDLMSVFHYLEIRFHPAIRSLASALCILVQIGSRMSVVLFLPSLAIATITGIPVTWSVLIMGGFTIVYTAMGGMKAVVWTDIVQLVVKMGGAIFAIIFMIWGLDGGFSQFLQVAAAEEKTKLFDFSFDLTKATVWGFIFLVLFDVVLTFPKDQVLMQRVLSTPSGKDAGRSIWAFALIMIPGGFVFYTIGTALFVFYKAHPERMDPLLSIDATFPLFIAAELPHGITGLIIAGIFSAAMATLSSIMNSVATLASVDFYEKWVKKPDPRKSVFFAEAMTVVAGLLGIGAALVLSRFDIHSLFDVSIELAGLLGGGFAGAYTLGMFTRRANAPGVAIGIGSAIVLTTLAWSINLVHPYFYLAISILLCIVIGYAASLFFPAPTRSLRGLTIHRQDRGAAVGHEQAGVTARAE